jgi:hypothetical protein
MMTYRRHFRYETGVTGVAEVTDGTPAAYADRRVRRPEWVAHVLDEASDPPRAVLLHLPSGRRTALSDTGTRVWQVIVASGAEGTNGVNIGVTLGPEYGVDPTIITHDVAGLLAEMVEGEWLEVVPESDDASRDAVGGER